jgi:hypothetical protein
MQGDRVLPASASCSAGLQLRIRAQYHHISSTETAEKDWRRGSAHKERGFRRWEMLMRGQRGMVLMAEGDTRWADAMGVIYLTGRRWEGWGKLGTATSSPAGATSVIKAIARAPARALSPDVLESSVYHSEPFTNLPLFRLPATVARQKLAGATHVMHGAIQVQGTSPWSLQVSFWVLRYLRLLPFGTAGLCPA